MIKLFMMPKALILLLICTVAHGQTFQFFGEDTYLQKGSPSNNYHTVSTILLRSDATRFERRGLMKFDLTSLPTNHITTAKLKLFSTTQSGTVDAVEISDNSWNISNVTWNTMPVFGATIGGGIIATNSWLEINLSSYITNAGIYSIGITTDENIAGRISSNEGSFPPVLEVGTYAVTNAPPFFHNDPIIEDEAITDRPYQRTLLDDASDPESNTLVFSKIIGPNWLTVESSGTITGTPDASDLGINLFTVNVADPDGSNDTATLEISVTNYPPSFTTNLIVEADALTNTLYSGTLFNDASDPEHDSMTFTKLSGPTWLTVATNGLLGGTPGTSDLGLNSFSVQVDAFGGTDTAAVEITVTDIPPPPADTRPNILIIEVDDLNYEYLSGWGSQANQTPHIDSLINSGVSFPNAMAPGMMCGPSRNCFLTGLFPHNIGFYRNGQMGDLQRGVWTFPAALQRADYYTAYLGKSHLHPYGNTFADFNEHFGFDFAAKTAGRAVLRNKPLTYNDGWYFPHLRNEEMLERFLIPESISTLHEEDYLDGFFTREAINFLTGYKEEEPFMLWLNYSLPHGPYDAQEEYHIYDSTNMPGGTIPTYVAPSNLVQDVRFFDPDNPANLQAIKNGQAGFCASIGCLDKKIGTLKEALAANNMLEDTIIVFFSDHGVMQGDHYRQNKGTLFRQVTNPALIISWPKGFQQNVVVSNCVEVQDLIPTALEVARASEADKAVRSRHKSLIPLLTGNGTYERDIAFAEIFPHGAEHFVAAISNEYRLIKGANDTLLFNEYLDPDNLTNIVASHPDVVLSMSAAIDEWSANTGPIYAPGELDSESLLRTEIPLTSTNLYIQGAPFAWNNTNGINFWRFNNPDSMPPEAKTTAGVKLTFFTRSRQAWLTFDYQSADFNLGSEFAVYQNGLLADVISVTTNDSSVLIELVSQSAPGDLVRYDLILPSFANPILSKLQLKEGLVLESGDPGQATHIGFIGDSITHGTGQGSATYKSYPFQVTEMLDATLQNLAIANDQINPTLADQLSLYANMDFLWILSGYEDFWTGSNSLATITNDYNTLLDNARTRQPNAQIFCCTPTYTINATNSSTGVTIAQVRDAIEGLVDTRIGSGDGALHLVKGETISGINFMADVVNFSESGAAMYATNVAGTISSFIDFDTWVHSINWDGETARSLRDDPDGDGLSNIAEYALKRSPTVAETDGLFTIASNSGNITATFKLGLGSSKVSYTLYLSNDLQAGWDTIPPLTITGAEDETIPLQLGTYGEPLFIQLSIGLK